MATTDTTTTQPGQAPIGPVSAARVPLSRFHQMVDRIKGTGRIFGEIISPDPEIWNCEIE